MCLGCLQSPDWRICYVQRRRQQESRHYPAHIASQGSGAREECNEGKESTTSLDFVPGDRPAQTVRSQCAHTHEKANQEQIAESIRVFGFTNPVLIDHANTIICGHGRVEAAKLLGMTEVPTICLQDLSKEQIRAYIIADNRLSEISHWDKSILAIELQNLLSLDCADFDVTITGFEIAEIDQILEDAKDAAEPENPIS
jgi:hypothetical protein